MSEYKKYPEYKDSGVEWLGEIPSDWYIVPVKKIARLKNGTDTFDGEKDSGQYPVYSSAGLFGMTSRFMAKGPSVMFGRKGTIDKPFFIKEGYFWHVDTVFRSEINESLVIPEMFFYMSKTINFKYLSAGAAVPSMTQTKIHDWKLALPSLETQKKIVSFLDTETKKIDDSVASMESLISLLMEKRSALISETVTRGIPGEHTEFKDSGVEWLGRVANSYKVVTTGRILSIKKEVVGSSYRKFQLLSLTKKGVINRDIDSGVGKFPESFDTYQVVTPENLVFCLFDTEETPRTVGLVQNKGMITGAYTRFEINKNLAIPKFLEYYFVSIDDKKGFKPLYTGLRKTIQKPRFLSSKLILPSMLEQERIVEFLDLETQKIDAISNEAKKSISLLKEKRQTLISDAVTGKIDVRDIVN